MIRRSFLLFVFIVYALASGWIEIHCNPAKVHKDIERKIADIKSIINNQDASQDVTERDFQQIQVFQNQSNKDFYLILHRVQPGERLTDIATMYGIHWRVIQRANGISDPNRLSPGRLIIVPVRKGYG